MIYVDKHLLKLSCIWNTFKTLVIILSDNSGKSHSSPETTPNSTTQKRFQRRDNMEGGFHSGNPTTFFSPISYSRTGTGYYWTFPQSASGQWPPSIIGIFHLIARHYSGAFPEWSCLPFEVWHRYWENQPLFGLAINNCICVQTQSWNSRVLV